MGKLDEANDKDRAVIAWMERVRFSEVNELLAVPRQQGPAGGSGMSHSSTHFVMSAEMIRLNMLFLQSAEVIGCGRAVIRLQVPLQPLSLHLFCIGETDRSPNTILPADSFTASGTLSSSVVYGLG